MHNSKKNPTHPPQEVDPIKEFDPAEEVPFISSNKFRKKEGNKTKDKAGQGDGSTETSDATTDSFKDSKDRENYKSLQEYKPMRPTPEAGAPASGKVENDSIDNLGHWENP